MPRRIAPALALALTAACSGAPVAPTPLLDQSCSQVAERLEKDSGISDAEKKALVEKLKAQPLSWRLKILSVSEQTSSQDLDHAMVVDAECIDRSSDTRQGVRYFLTVYFNSRHQAELVELGKGDQITVNGHLNLYEGGNAFSIMGKDFTR